MGMADASARERAFTVRVTSDCIWCTKQIERMGSAWGLSRDRISRACIIACELITNMVKFAGGGVLTVTRMGNGTGGMEIRAEDRGPGIADIELALRDGYSEGHVLGLGQSPRTGRGLGLGLGSIYRLADELRIENKPASGLLVIARLKGATK